MDPSPLRTSGIEIKGTETMLGAAGVMSTCMVDMKNEEDIGERAKTDGRNIDPGSENENERGI